MTKSSEAVPALAGLTFDELQECLSLGATLDQITSLAEGGFSYAHIKQLAPALGAHRAAGGGISKDDLKDLMNAQRKALRPENEQHPGISVYSYPEGELARPKPPLRRETYFCGAREKADLLDPQEIELYNRFTVSTTARGGKWEATIRQRDGVESLWITCAGAHNPDSPTGPLPALTLILRELLDGPSATDPETLSQRVAQLEAALKAQLPAGVGAAA